MFFLLQPTHIFISAFFLVLHTIFSLLWKKNPSIYTSDIRMVSIKFRVLSIFYIWLEAQMHIWIVNTCTCSFSLTYQCYMPRVPYSLTKICLDTGTANSMWNCGFLPDVITSCHLWVILWWQKNKHCCFSNYGAAVKIAPSLHHTSLTLYFKL